MTFSALQFPSIGHELGFRQLINELLPFEKDMTRLIQNIKFKDTKCSFQSKLNADIKNKIKRPNTLLIPADKTTNVYAMNPSSYDKLVKENVTKTYKKSNDKLVGELDAKSAKIAERLKLHERIEKLARKEAFVTLKDHKANFYETERSQIFFLTCF